MAAIAGVLLFIAWGLVDWEFIRRVTRTTKADTSVLAATFVATLTIPLEYAVLVGITLNIALYLQRTTQLQMQEMIPTDRGPFREQPVTAESGARSITFLQLEGSLFFAQAEEFENQLQSLLRSPVRVVIFRLRRVHSIDATMLGVLEQFTSAMLSEGRHVVICGVHPELMERLEHFGLIGLIGEENVFHTDAGVFASAQTAIERAKELT
jgi:SulP family sulfate permease